MFSTTMRCCLSASLLLAAFALSAPAQYRVTEGRAVPDVPTVVLEDEAHGLKAAIAPSKGAELASLQVRHKGEWVELLYLANDYRPTQDFAGKAPLLWPATGRNFTPKMLEQLQASGKTQDGGAWIVDGKEYPMAIHGFARDFPWKLERQYTGADGAVAVLSLDDSAETRRMYPFGFHLTALFQAGNGTFDIVYTVRASERNSQPMPFSIGNHIAFRTPLLKGSPAAAMELETPATVELVKSRFSVPTGERREWTSPKTIGGVPARTAVSLTGYHTAEPYVRLRDPGGLGIRMSHSATQIPAQPVLLFNLWGDPAAGFFSPEPWIGLQNSLNLGQGLVRLEPGKTFEWRIQIVPEH